METAYTKEIIKDMVLKRLSQGLDVENTMDTSNMAYYKAAALVARDIATEKRKRFLAHKVSSGKKQVYYLSMEFLLGRHLKNTLFNLGIEAIMKDVMRDFDVKLENLYECEPDAGLGNGGLGRLAACYMDGLAHEDYLATGYCILYEFGIFKQRIIDGWQTESPDQWLPGGEVWLIPNQSHSVEVRFGGEVVESWEDGYHSVEYKNYQTVIATPYDINITSYNSDGISLLRVWQAKTPTGVDMDLFNAGNYAKAFQQAYIGEAISAVLYPNDNHNEGKNLRLRQQYFLCAASIADICRRHLAVYETLSNFADKNAIHINDTHPTLAIPEFMRCLLDDCGYSWEVSWDIVTRTFAYTNHTVMNEALERWDENLLRSLLPRIYSIICEINRRHCADMFERAFANQAAVQRMSILLDRQIRMANLAVVGSHSVNGVSKLHTQILKDEVFNDFYRASPEKFTNVTNGIASRRWLLQANPGLTKLIADAIGPGFKDDFTLLGDLNSHTGDRELLDKLALVKYKNKEAFCKYVKQKTGRKLDPSSIFDVQVKRLHEYKRQQMNALDIIATCQWIKDNPGADFTPRTYIFGAKAAPGYYMAKQIIKLICSLSDMIDKDPALSKKVQVVFLEEYNVTMSELLMPASEVSEQISLAGTEASGTGNMKLMLNGALTLGTLDGANVEIREVVGDDNIIIFGMNAGEVAELRAKGYHPQQWYERDPVIRRAVDTLQSGIDGNTFPDIHDMLLRTDYYMTLADFAAYRKAREDLFASYTDTYTWQRQSLVNIAQSAIFCADRAVTEYADDIWGLEK
ncbi:glycogen/starch/alpha-glucan phosphorylase [Ruminococcaceae bacterium OttesenSCG-928-L11]|nr:glycogen/starch/alpha-glucan phosphorylase [Ruminococcaceae bacterium OttesenSCG-928-L11]